MNIRLTNDHAVAASAVATLQILRKLARNRATDHGSISHRSIKRRWADTLHGILGEMALAEATGKTWTPGGIQISTGDVGRSLEVRTTDHPKGHLLVYPHDSDDSTFWLVRGDFPDFQIVGSITGRDAKNPEFLNVISDPPCYWVPDNALTPPNFTTP